MKKTGRAFFVETYVRGEIISAALRKHENFIKRYAYIYHDQDVWQSEDKAVLDGKHIAGEKKTPHWHVLLELRNSYEERLVKDWFFDIEDQQNTNTSIVTSKRACYRYLTHRDNPEKFQYSAMGIVTDDRDFYESLALDEGTNGDDLVQAVCDLASGASTREVLSYYGRDLICNYANVRRITDDICREEKMLALIGQLQQDLAVLSAQVQTYATQRNELQKQLNSLRTMKSNEYYTEQELEEIFK